MPVARFYALLADRQFDEMRADHFHPDEDAELRQPQLQAEPASRMGRFLPVVLCRPPPAGSLLGVTLVGRSDRSLSCRRTKWTGRGDRARRSGFRA